MRRFQWCPERRECSLGIARRLLGDEDGDLTELFETGSVEVKPGMVLVLMVELHEKMEPLK